MGICRSWWFGKLKSILGGMVKVGPVIMLTIVEQVAKMNRGIQHRRAV